MSATSTESFKKVFTILETLISISGIAIGASAPVLLREHVRLTLAIRATVVQDVTALSGALVAVADKARIALAFVSA